MIVKSTMAVGKIALWERHPDHPDGEVFIADQEPVEVAPTEQVHKRLAKGWLVEVKAELPVEESEKAEPSKPAPAETEPAPGPVEVAPEAVEGPPVEDKPKRRSR